jgi:hypothetical protein
LVPVTISSASMRGCGLPTRVCWEGRLQLRLHGSRARRRRCTRQRAIRQRPSVRERSRAIGIDGHGDQARGQVGRIGQDVREVVEVDRLDRRHGGAGGRCGEQIGGGHQRRRRDQVPDEPPARDRVRIGARFTDLDIGHGTTSLGSPGRGKSTLGLDRKRRLLAALA